MADTGVSLVFEDKTVQQMSRMLSEISALDRNPVVHRGMTEAAKVVINRWKQLLPPKSQAYRWDEDLMSGPTQASHASTGPLWKLVTHKRGVLQYGNGITVKVIGYGLPAAARHFPLLAGHTKYLWGRATGEKVPGYYADVGRVAERETRTQYNARLTEYVRKAVANIMAKAKA